MTEPGTLDTAPQNRKKIRLGDLLVEAGLISEGQLGLALQEQKHTGKKIGRVLVDMGLMPENKLLNTLSKHLNIPFVEMRQFQLKQDVMQQLDESVARRFRCLLLADNADGLLLAMVVINFMVIPAFAGVFAKLGADLPMWDLGSAFG